MNYEYQVVTFKDPYDFEAELSRKASCGWRLHSWQNVSGDQGWNILTVFERPPIQKMTEPPSSSME